MSIKILSAILAGLTLAACSHHHPHPETAAPQPDSNNIATPAARSSLPVNDFPTLARVEYVFECMQKSGGQNYDTLYHCACSLDKLAESMTFEQYNQAQTFTQLFSLGGERGGEFRDPPEAQKLREKLKTVREAANTACFVKYKESGKKSK